MSDKTALGDRMKRYEAAYRAVLPRRTYTVIRVDGRAFHTYLRHAARPYDTGFMADMDAVAEALCKEITGSVFAYTQSDEVSVLVTDFADLQTEPWFGGVVAKQISISAAVATAEITARNPGRGRPPLFDSRLFTLSDPVEVANYFLWRQRDAVRNSISMTAQAHFSARRLLGVSTDQMQELLWSEAGVNWSDQPAGFKRGRITVRETDQDTITPVRSWWETRAAPHFVAESGSWLAGVIPPLPSFTREASC